MDIASIPPVISNIQQDPPKDNVGYRDIVNVSCEIEAYAPIDRVQINWTTDKWKHYRLVDMTGSGNGTYWGQIPITLIIGTLYTYFIYVLDQQGAHSSSDLYNYTTIDNYPPTIYHENSSDWVTPLHPFINTIANPNPVIRWNCTVIDEATAIPWARLNYTAGPGQINVSCEMTGDQKYTYAMVISIGISQIFYNIRAIDNNGNEQITPTFCITLDQFGPNVTSWTDPVTPQYNDSVYIYVNATDWNAVNTVELKWSLDWMTNYTVSMSNIQGDTWRTDTPIPPLAWQTAVFWEIYATDEGGYSTIEQYSYIVADLTPPNVTGLVYKTDLAPKQPNRINVTVYEPVSASGVKTRLLYYGLASEAYAYHPLSFNPLAGDTWTALIPGVEDETVRWYIYIEDNAGNNYTSDIHQYSVVGGGGIPVFELIPLLIGLACGISVGRHYITQKKNAQQILRINFRENLFS